MAWFDQNAYDIKFEWGLEGAKQLSHLADVVVVVDILSFTTCVEAALSCGGTVFPYLYKDHRADDYARSLGAILANPKRSKEDICLSPPTLLSLKPGDKVVLPSPNGSTISFSLGNKPVLAGCLRNAESVAKAANQIGRNVLVVASGEKWEGGDLRPAIEDVIGAGAVLSKLTGSKSPEAEAAVAVFQKFESRLSEILNGCSSGRELIEKGYPEDVMYAAALNTSSVVPVLRDRHFSAL